MITDKRRNGMFKIKNKYPYSFGVTYNYRIVMVAVTIKPEYRRLLHISNKADFLWIFLMQSIC